MKNTINLLTGSVKLYLGLLIISTAGILYATLFPTNYEVPQSFYGLDKVVHFIMFGAWTFFFGIVRFLKNNYKLLSVFIVAVIFGITIEILQHWLPTGRSFELYDLLADFAGTAVAILTLYILSKTVPQFSSN
ncbi:VanZ family protein [Gracilimonas sp.]|uniref:VanZ family protein n=1 Tax=Gracilimonas sp. TaxID=1974203 RepID=UPI002872246C|nr:VanZ family protein [Gracilimonas sp.]